MNPGTTETIIHNAVVEGDGRWHTAYPAWQDKLDIDALKEAFEGRRVLLVERRIIETVTEL